MHRVVLSESVLFVGFGGWLRSRRTGEHGPDQRASGTRPRAPPGRGSASGDRGRGAVAGRHGLEVANRLVDAPTASPRGSSPGPPAPAASPGWSCEGVADGSARRAASTAGCAAGFLSSDGRRGRQTCELSPEGRSSPPVPAATRPSRSWTSPRARSEVWPPRDAASSPPRPTSPARQLPGRPTPRHRRRHLGDDRRARPPSPCWTSSPPVRIFSPVGSAEPRRASNKRRALAVRGSAYRRRRRPR